MKCFDLRANRVRAEKNHIARLANSKLLVKASF